MAPTGGTTYLPSGLITPLAGQVHGDSPYSSGTNSDDRISDLVDREYGSNQHAHDGARVEDLPGTDSRNSRQQQRSYSVTSSTYKESETEDDEYDDDSNHLHTTGSLLEYSDTSEDYTTHYTSGSYESRRREPSRISNGSIIYNNNSVRSDIRHHPSKGVSRDDSILLTGSLGNSTNIRNSGNIVYVIDEQVDQNSPDDVEYQNVSSRRAQARGLRQDRDNNNSNNSIFSWMTQLAYSFRSPQTTHKIAGTHIRKDSTDLEEYPHHSIRPSTQSTNTPNYQSTTTGTGLPHPCPPRPISMATSRNESTGSISSQRISTTEEFSPLLGSAYYSLGGRQRSNDTRRSSRQKLFASTGRFDVLKYRNVRNEPHTLITLAASFLQDYEANRPPTFGYVVNLGDVTRYQTSLHKFKYSNSFIGFPMFLWASVICLFTSSSLESFNSSFEIGGEAHSSSQLIDTTSGSTSIEPITPVYSQVGSLLMDKRLLLTILNMIGIVILAIDMWMRHQLRDPAWHLAFDSFYPIGSSPQRILQRKTSVATRSVLTDEVRTSRAEKLIKPLIIFCVVLVVENIARLVVKEDHTVTAALATTRTGSNNFVLFSSIFKPLVLFYVSSQARDAFGALSAILNVVLRVLFLEVILILMFAAVACRLFPQYESFANLWNAWLSLFELSTTVVNPSLWMPMYAANNTNAIFFIVFIIASVFYLHSLVLSVVFQTYIMSASEIHERSNADREVALHLAYESLQKLHDEHNTPVVDAKLASVSGKPTTPTMGYIDVELVRETLKLVRPHYNAPKINVLVDIINPSNQDSVDFETFRTRIRQALNASLRTPRNPSALGVIIELIAVFVGFINFAYVILVTSVTTQSHWFYVFQEEVGCAITLLAAFELLIRFNPLRIPDFAPLTRLNSTFDGLALIAAITSGWGVILFTQSIPTAVEWILMGRSIDMIRTMRFFPIFRDVVRRSGDVLPAMLGPLVLVFSTIHVLCYLGMALWGGAVRIGTHPGEIFDLYDYNNFNSYREGAVTIFQILVVNDWQALAQIFRLADRCSSPLIVYPFFIFCNLIGVNVMLNVMTAFFVESFVSKLNEDKDSPAEATESSLGIHLFDREPVGRITTNMMGTSSEFSKRNINSSVHNNSCSKKSDGGESDRGADADSETSSISEMHEFDVYEREGFDKIMQTVAGSPSQIDYARQVCHYLEVFEALAPYRESVGYLVCDQQSLERFGNRRFKTKSIGTLEENELHATVTDMHTELVMHPPGPHMIETSIIRTFQHKRDPTKTFEISASLIRRYPALSLFVSRLTKEEPSKQSKSEQQTAIALTKPIFPNPTITTAMQQQWVTATGTNNKSKASKKVKSDGSFKRY